MNEDTTPITVQEKMCLGTVVDWTGRDGMMEGTNEIMYNYHWTVLTTLLPFMISHSAIFWPPCFLVLFMDARMYRPVH